LGGEVFGIPAGAYIQGTNNRGGWTGGRWGTYQWRTPDLGPHLKIALAAGHMWNGTGFMFACGTVHLPDTRRNAANCKPCSADSALPCTAVNVQSLVGHAQAEFLTPDGQLSRLSDDEWFGAMHAGSISMPHNGTSPRGFYVFGFDYNGTCVVDGNTRSNVGKEASQLLGGALHNKFKSVADNGGGWLQYSLADGIQRLAYVLQLAKFGRFYYLGSAFVKQRGEWHEDCRSHYSEPCASVNAETLVGLANADITSTGNLTSLISVLQEIGSRFGAYAEQAVGDFKVQVFSDSWACPPSLPAQACPRTLPKIWTPTLQAAGGIEGGSWVLLPKVDQDQAQVAYVYRSTWAPSAGISTAMMLVAFVKASPAPPRCDASSSGACPGNATCTSEGRCDCKPGFRTKFTLDSSFCGPLRPAEMACEDVRGLDCSSGTCQPCAAGFFCSEGSPSPCPMGQYCPSGSAVPMVCQPGTFGNTLQAESLKSCTQCPAGASQPQGGQIVCIDCEPGSAGSTVGATACDPCQVGRFSVLKGITQCEACPLLSGGLHTTEAPASRTVDACVCAIGAYAEAGGSCRRCPANSTTASTKSATPLACLCEAETYLVATLDRCEPCPSGSTTVGAGKTTVGSCLCERGDYMPLDASGCKPCPEGMSCPKGSSEAFTRGLVQGGESSFLQLAPGFWSRVTDPMAVFRCESVRTCPGGSPGTCAVNRETTSVACGRCTANTHSDAAGNCTPCESSDVIFAVFFGLAVTAFVSVLTVVVNQDLVKQTQKATLMAIIVGLALASVQVLGLFSSLTVSWPDPLGELLEAMAFVTLNVKLARIQCTIGSTAASSFFCRQLVLPIGIVIIVTTVLVKSRIAGYSASRRIDVCNAVGTFFQTMFISITSSAVAPFVCYQHPGKSGYSMISEPSVLCFEGSEHRSMVALSIVMLCVVVLPFLALVISAVAAYGRHLRNAISVSNYVRMFAFLFSRYRPECYYNSLLSLARGFLISMIPSVARASPPAQVILIGGTLLWFSHWQVRLQPWRAAEANLIDTVLANLLNIILVCGALSMNTDTVRAFQVIGYFAAASFVLLFVLAACTLVYAFYRRFVPSTFYEWFICHHKKHAAAQARLLQQLMAKRCNGAVFIDSDHLVNLDTLFDVVRTQTNRLLVYLTASTLRRPWCAGEITVTYRTHQRILVVRTPSFIQPSAGDLEPTSMPTFLEDGVKLAVYALTDEDVSDALKWVTSTNVSTISLDASGCGAERFRRLVDETSRVAASRLSSHIANSFAASHISQSFASALFSTRSVC
jgi:hypothetical protein